MLNITDSNFEQEVAKHKGVVVVDFYADWCGPCKIMAPIFEETSKKLKEAKFVKLNVDNARETASEFGVMSIPTLIIFKDGEEVERLMGVQQKDQFANLIKRYI